MKATAKYYFDLGISAATRKAYTVGLRRYFTFCSKTKLKQIPALEDTLLLFITHLTQQNLSFGTIQVYLSAVRYYHMANHEDAKLASDRTPRLTQVLKGIRKSNALTHTRHDKQPITFPIMHQLQPLFTKHPSCYPNIMIWAAFCCAHFGLLRISELTALLLSDVAVDSHTFPQMVRLTIRQSKTDQFRHGTYVYLGKTGHNVCPVAALVKYLGKQTDKPGLLFILPDNRLLSRNMFRAVLNKAFTDLRLHPGSFNTHSFRIRAATSTAHAGISEPFLKTLGRWKSNAYQKYIKPSPKDLARLSKTLVTTT